MIYLLPLAVKQVYNPALSKLSQVILILDSIM